MTLCHLIERLRSHTRWLPAAAIGLAGLVVALPVVRAEDEPQAKPSAGKHTVNDLSFMTGVWRGEGGGQRIEESWSTPAGDCLVGMLRWMRQDKVWLFEAMAVVRQGDELVFYLRHFDRQFTAWEEKKEPFVYPLIELEDRRVVFENPERDHPRRIIYHREDDDTLVIRLEGIDKGEPKSDVFRLSRGALQPAE